MRLLETKRLSDRKLQFRQTTRARDDQGWQSRNTGAMVAGGTASEQRFLHLHSIGRVPFNDNEVVGQNGSFEMFLVDQESAELRCRTDESYRFVLRGGG